MPVFRYQSVKRVQRLQVGQICPGAEDTQGPELAPVLVRHDVVWIVRAGTGVSEGADDFAGQETAGHYAVRPVRVPGHALEQLVDVVARERRPLSVWTPEGSLRIELHVFWIERRQEGLDLIVSKRPEEFCRHDHCGGRGLRVVIGVELEKPRLPFRIACGDPRMRTGSLLSDDRPAR